MDRRVICRNNKLFFFCKTTFFYSILFMYLLTIVVSEECKKINNCKCKFSNGSVIDLTSIGYEHEARFTFMIYQQDKDYVYYYNPCYPFSLSNSNGTCQNVAVCQLSNKSEYQNCGTQDSDGFVWNSQTNHLNIIYTHGNRTTNVTLNCDRDAKIPSLVVVGENPSEKDLYIMTLTTRCACPDLCHESHLSAGSVLIIIFLIFVSLYLVLGIIHSSLTRGAQGWELIPHYEFWADFPLLVRDGCVFVMSGCKADTAYERI